MNTTVDLYPNYVDEIIVAFNYVDTFETEYQDTAKKIYDKYMEIHEYQDLTEVDIMMMDSMVLDALGIDG